MKMDIRQVQATCGQLESRMDNLRNQMSQLMTMFQKQNDQSLLSNTGNNPRRVEKEHVKAITLRSGKTLEKPKEPNHEEENVPKKVDKTMEKEAEHHEPWEEIAKPVSDLVITKPSTTKVPFST